MANQMIGVPDIQNMFRQEKSTTSKVYVEVIEYCLNEVIKAPDESDFWWARMTSILKRKNLFDIQKGRCMYCKKPITANQIIHENMIQKHHLKPNRSGGTNGLHNIKLLHGYCHTLIHEDYSREEMAALVDKGIDYLES